MGVCVGDIVGWLEKLAPPHLAAEWDNVGLLVGSYDSAVNRVITCLSPSVAVIEQAVCTNAQLIVSHHPLIFRPLRSVRSDRPLERIVARLIKHNLSLYAAHTNLDAAPNGLGTWMGTMLGIQNGKPLVPGMSPDLKKLVVYVPLTHVDIVRNVITEAGAGHIDSYSHCTFSTTGTGTFMPTVGTHPFVGTVNQLEKAQEVRLETVVPADLLGMILARMFAVHPYEEVAYDVFDLKLPSNAGYGWVGSLAEPTTLDDFICMLSHQFKQPHLRFAGTRPAVVKTVASVNGSGAEYIDQAAEAGVEVFVTGDMRYHDAEKACLRGICVIDIGHFASEAFVASRIASHLESEINKRQLDCSVQVADEEDYLSGSR